MRCADCKYLKCGVGNCYCTKIENDLNVPRLIHETHKTPEWCPLEKNNKEKE